jgi:hypothetical protein
LFGSGKNGIREGSMRVFAHVGRVLFFPIRVIGVVGVFDFFLSQRSFSRVVDGFIMVGRGRGFRVGVIIKVIDVGCKIKTSGGKGTVGRRSAARQGRDEGVKSEERSIGGRGGVGGGDRRIKSLRRWGGRRRSLFRNWNMCDKTRW